MIPMYKPVVHDYNVTLEQRVHLLAGAANKVWLLWPGEDEPIISGPILTDAMRALYTELNAMDLFMAGVHYERKRLEDDVR